jgi:hypothetical protein
MNRVVATIIDGKTTYMTREEFAAYKTGAVTEPVVEEPVVEEPVVEEPVGPTKPHVDYDDLTAKDIVKLLDDDELNATNVLVYEKANKARRTILRWYEDGE